MIVTHQDTDHSGGALSLLQTVPVDWLASSLPAEHAILARRAADGGSALRCEAGQRWTWDGVRFDGAAADGRALRDAAAQAQRPVVRRAHRVATTAARS